MVASNDHLLARVQKHFNGFGLTGDLAVGINDLVFGLLVADDQAVGQRTSCSAVGRKISFKRYRSYMVDLQVRIASGSRP